MRQLKTKDFQDLEVRDIIALPASNEDREESYYLAIVSNIKRSKDKTAIDQIEILPIMDIEKVTHKYKVETIDIDDPETLRNTGLESPHCALLIGIQVTQNDMLDKQCWYLGYLNREFRTIENRLNALSVSRPELFNFSIKALAALKGPTVKVVEYVERFQASARPYQPTGDSFDVIDPTTTPSDEFLTVGFGDNERDLDFIPEI